MWARTVGCQITSSDQVLTSHGTTDGAPTMDTKTGRWLIPSKPKEEFESTKFDVIACPLRVY